jgi:hypothetical protein
MAMTPGTQSGVFCVEQRQQLGRQSHNFLILLYLIAVGIVSIVCSVSFIVCVVLCAVLFCVMCVIVVPLPPGKNSFAV